MTTKTIFSVEAIAQICHEANRALCEVCGDLSQVGWDQAPAWQRESAIAGVEWRLQNPYAPISAQHEQWAADKEAAGWRYGPVKDPEAKTHPCLVPFEKLPAEQKAKDKLFVGIVCGLSERL